MASESDKLFADLMASGNDETESDVLFKALISDRDPRLGRYEEVNEDYSAFRSGAVEFVEGAIGAGDELDALIRRMTGDADTWDEAITESRADLERFGDENPLTSTLLFGTGLVSGFFIPGAGMVKVAQAGTKAQRAMKVGALSAAEGSVYGFLASEGDERASGALMGAGVGGVLGAASGAFLTKGATKATDKFLNVDGQGSHIGGVEGFSKSGKVKQGGRLGFAADTTLGARTAGEVTEGEAGRAAHTEGDFLDSVFLSTKEWISKHASPRAARLAEDSGTMIRADEQMIEEVFDTTLKGAQELFENNRALKTMALNMNETLPSGKRVSWEDLKNATKSPNERSIIENLEDQVKLLQSEDFVKSSDVDFFPTKRLPGFDSVRKPTDSEYFNPLIAVKDYAQDISAAKVLAHKFGIDFASVKQPVKGEVKSRLNLVIEAIGKEAKDQGASSDVAANLMNGLTTQMVASKQGGNTIGAILRRVTSTALLANPLNAVLNMAEGVTAPIYQNGVRAWAETLPGAILSTFQKTAGIKNKNWMSQHQLGLDSDFMGELAQAGKKEMTNAAETARMVKIGNVADIGNKTLYGLSGVSTVNRMGQEMLANSAIKRGMKLAKSGSKKSLDKLRKHDGMRGLDEVEFQATINALKEGSMENPWMVNFAGASLNKWQPVSAATLPKAFHDNPNGRMMYSMLSYMNRQMNGMRTDIGLNMYKAKQLGVNSKEGATAMREAMLNSAKYAGIFGVAAGIWDDFRMTLDQSKEDKTLANLFTPDGVSNAFMNQIGSNISSGIMNIRAEEYGGDVLEPIPAPVSALFRLGSGGYSTGKNLLTGENDPFNPLLKATQTYVPGFSNIDRIVRMGTGKRLLTDD